MAPPASTPPVIVDSATLAAVGDVPYAPYVAAAIDAVRLASALTAGVQRGLGAGEAADKEDESPVTVADYGRGRRWGAFRGGNLGVHVTGSRFVKCVVRGLDIDIRV